MAENLTVNTLNLPCDFPDNWLIGGDSGEFARIVDRQLQQITQNQSRETPPKICLAEPEPLQFLASFIAARAAKCQIFLCNPNWVKEEWEQVFDLVQPDLILEQNTDIKKIFPPLPVRAPSGLRLYSREFHSPGFNHSPEFNHSPGFHHSPGLNHSPEFHHSRELPSPEIDELATIMIPTGGSSGKIRFAIHTSETLTASVQGFQEYFQVDKINSFCVLPLYHVSGLMQFMRSFTTGGKLAIASFKALETSQKCDIEPEEFFISLVPTQLQRLLQNPDTANWLSRFRAVLLGGAPAWPELLVTARNHQIKLAPTYGMTETASQIATLKPEDFLAGNNTSGQALPHAKITIRSASGEILCHNQIGNIAVDAKSLALGYYPERFGDRQYFQLDDLGFFDNNNCLNIVGRSSDKIITGGENVFPAQVEAAIKNTNLVADVAVIGLADKDWGQVITAIYVPTNSEVTVKNLQAAIEDKLSKFKRPKNWVVVEQLPRNAQGKVNREQLQELAIKNLRSEDFSPHQLKD
ncbi:MAG: 2-succinylbenzoate--CoA ligase [Microcoleus sp. PH2017_10_PVI_O_A]|uniref:2-succinylbenzoate--CoA ligase n=1 Tax=unclassified Microcoleus TaxID=2642155 RepID=UPI001D1ABA9F|nr:MULTISPECIES: 2-succinylbenzoate--CoA ligase [unclassified Microcoleus]TAF17263.1 MAG: 2-succinylbenzoate--CoA ligase [Oscillatoriales cyanobacterium]MCC3407526.1 2-succinylbenzoate--CoA ligase [Microcoleus sp. PH2017_10_PVI_O_A]MCC3460155.1 2-succinylbenzoate--CoA ligase [Microcoleus sp. PH2017_11_PCY_U_A]MCC3480115.1 2-succinylbenzoate--CoA ligase [Microcoleus sp. PH2017_12_PCY_D_A]MCC3529615.1 2-succinylbenzoate--CoA ligase [Microcoleus sp. PH2017_21_RUC_O_A]